MPAAVKVCSRAKPSAVSAPVTGVPTVTFFPSASSARNEAVTRAPVVPVTVTFWRAFPPTPSRRKTSRKSACESSPAAVPPFAAKPTAPCGASFANSSGSAWAPADAATASISSKRLMRSPHCSRADAIGLVAAKRVRRAATVPSLRSSTKIGTPVRLSFVSIGLCSRPPRLTSAWLRARAAAAASSDTPLRVR